MLQSYDSRNADILININGELFGRADAGVSPFDSVVQGGDAVWEGLRVYEGRIFQLQEHLDRLRRSAQAVSFDSIPDDAIIIDEIRRTLEANGMQVTDLSEEMVTKLRDAFFKGTLDLAATKSGDAVEEIRTLAINAGLDQ